VTSAHRLSGVPSSISNDWPRLVRGFFVASGGISEPLEEFQPAAAILRRRFLSQNMKKIFLGGEPCALSGRALMDFLVKHFTLLGIDFQWWMPIVGGALALYVLWLRWTGQR
jgi:hypothetical protein